MSAMTKRNIYYSLFFIVLVVVYLFTFMQGNEDEGRIEKTVVEERDTQTQKAKIPTEKKQIIYGTPEIGTSGTMGQWERNELGGNIWSGYTIAVPANENVYFLHGKDVEVLHQNGKWERWKDILPDAVGPFSDVTWDLGNGIIVLVGKNKPGFRFDLLTKRSTSEAALTLPSARGTRIVSDFSGNIYCARGGLQDRSFGVVKDAVLEDLPKSRTVTALGVYAAGLFRYGEDNLIAFGDHHIALYDLKEQDWVESERAYTVMGIRPALDRGGMVTQDPDTYNIFVTLGKKSRSIGVADFSIKRFFHLKPRLPYNLSEQSRTLYVTRGPQGKQLNLLDLSQKAIYSIPLKKMRRIGFKDKLADYQSKWQVWNTSSFGAHGELVRERDSFCNILYVEPYLYIQRKNLVRQMNVKTLRHSENAAGFRYCKTFIERGAGLATDGKERMYVNNGQDRQFWSLELYLRDDGEEYNFSEPLQIKDMLVKPLAPLPEKPAGNTTLAYVGGSVYALFDPVTRILHRFDQMQNSWEPVTLLPRSMPYNTIDGADLLVAGDDLIFISGGWMAKYSKTKGWSEPSKLSFIHSADGGMAVVDKKEGNIYVAIGGGSRDLAVVSLSDGSSKVLGDFFPDAVSVQGKRMMIIEHKDGRYLYIYRGHDTSELWRVSCDEIN